MSTIPHTPIAMRDIVDLSGVRLRVWSNLANGDVGEPIVLTKFNDRTVMAVGTWDGGTITFMGSNDGVTYLPMRDVFNATVSATADKLITLTEVPLYIRPEATGGALMSVTCTVCAVGRE